MKLIFIIVNLMVFTISQSVASDWDQMVDDVMALEEIDRRAVVMMTRGHIRVNFQRTLDRALNSGGDDTLWGLKTISIADGWMMKFSRSVGWEKMGEYYENEAKNLAKHIRGEISWSEYVEASGTNKELLRKIVEPYVRNRSFHVRMERNKPFADRIGKYIVGSSKLRAGE